MPVKYNKFCKKANIFIDNQSVMCYNIMNFYNIIQSYRCFGRHGGKIVNFKYEVSVIIPVYNVEEYLEHCLDSLIEQTVDKSVLEVLLIDDGSTDNSPAICDRYAEKYDFFHVFHNENGGVSNARNFGIENAHGKYIMFLDSDDWLTKKTIKNIVNFFNKHYDETDIVTYRELRSINDEIREIKHYRYEIVNKTGVYDLNSPEYMYFVQTHMNICIKNLGEKNVKFDTTMIVHEDQKFILSILADKQKIGFCSGASYIYLQNADGASSNRTHPYYIFDKTMEMWETLFGNGKVPKYIQAYFVNDFRWKIRSDVLWPYHYKGEEFEYHKNRIINLLKRVDDDVIANFPWLIPSHQAFIFELKYGKERMSVKTEKKDYSICLDGEKLLTFDKIEMFLSRFKVKNGFLTLVGIVKCVAANFTDDIKLQAKYVGEKAETVDIPLKYSSTSLCASQTKTNNFKMFVIKRSVKDLKRIEFTASVNGHQYPIYMAFAGSSPFCRKLHRMSYTCEDMNIKFRETQENISFSFKKVNVFNLLRELIRNIFFAPKIGLRNTLTRIQAPKYKKAHRIWLYCDSSKTVKDNAYYQFLHDVKKKDGIERYYIYNPQTDIKGWFDSSLKSHLIPYGSLKHRLYALSADKFLTSFYGQRDMLSYPYGAMKYFFDLVNFDVIYLQHGVLHAHLPTMYSLDRMILDKEVISTAFEEKNLIENYCFDETFLIKSGMPRYDHIDTAKKAEKKILFAPSWRKFLVQSDGKGSWNPKDKTFVNSEFYKVTSEFLSDPRLKKALKDNGYVLDFKLHPNFRCYDKFYELDGETIRLADKTVDEFSYSVFITDFSSFVFDFIYLKRPILYFVPDKDLFDAGLNHYRELDIPLDDGFGELSSTSEKAVNDLIALIENNCVPEEKYVNKMNGLFFDVQNHSEELYNNLINE